MMPIDIKEFQKLGEHNAKNKIFEFLEKEKDKAFEYTELARLLDESERTVNAYLSILKKEGKVLHKQPYWTYNREYSKSSNHELNERRGHKIVPSMFRYEGDGIFIFKSDPSIRLNLNGPIKMVEAELTKHGLWSKNVVGFYYLLRKGAGLLNKRIDNEFIMDNGKIEKINATPIIVKKNISLRQALINLLKSENKVVDLQEIFLKIEDFYEVSNYQRELDPKYPYPRIQHEIRSHLKKLVNDDIVSHPSRAKYCINH